MKLAVLGDPLSFTLSPALHEAGLAVLGIDGASRAVPTAPEELAARLDALEAEGLRGVNLTIPHKEAVLPLLGRVSATARRTRSVNTVGFGPEGRWGDTTDGAGFLDFLAGEGIAIEGQRILMLGAGGAARSVLDALSNAGAEDLAVLTRDPARHAGALAALGIVAPIGFDSRAARPAFERATIVVHATPARALTGPLDPSSVPASAVAIDLGYGPEPTAWVRALREREVRAFDGVGMLVHQARRSLAAWTGRDVPLDPLRAAVGWPR
jgi:shikimate dehydrogenase